MALGREQIQDALDELHRIRILALEHRRHSVHALLQTVLVVSLVRCVRRGRMPRLTVATRGRELLGSRTLRFFGDLG